MRENWIQAAHRQAHHISSGESFCVSRCERAFSFLVFFLLLIFQMKYLNGILT